MCKSRKVAAATVCLVVLFGLTNSAELAMNETAAALNTTNNLLRDPQGQFIEWVLSLISQRPPFGATATTTTTTTRPSTTAVPSPTEATASSTTTSAITQAPQRNCSDCVCGLANKKKRIVGGQETEVNQYPWMALLMYKTRFYCAATLINDLYVVTASHCIHGFKKEHISVRLLDHSRSMSHPNKIDRKVVEAIVHPKYSSRNFDSDIAILKLDEAIVIKERLRPVCLPSVDKDFAGETGIVTGWGATAEGGPISDTLQEVHVPILSMEQCRGSKYGATRISDNMLCAGFDEGKKDSCQGDSGGPLHVVDGEEHQLVGVVSWGEGCAKPKYPGVYTRVNRFDAWIKSKTEDACYCHPVVKKRNA